MFLFKYHLIHITSDFSITVLKPQFLGRYPPLISKEYFSNFFPKHTNKQNINNAYIKETSHFLFLKSTLNTLFYTQSILQNLYLETVKVNGMPFVLALYLCGIWFSTVNTRKYFVYFVCHLLLKTNKQKELNSIHSNWESNSNLIIFLITRMVRL